MVVRMGVVVAKGREARHEQKREDQSNDADDHEDSPDGLNVASRSGGWTTIANAPTAPLAG